MNKTYIKFEVDCAEGSITPKITQVVGNGVDEVLFAQLSCYLYDYMHTDETALGWYNDDFDQEEGCAIVTVEVSNSFVVGIQANEYEFKVLDFYYHCTI
jgi:hypothetical protein